MYYLKNTNFWMFGLFFFFYFFIMGAYFPFFPIWLHDINHISKSDTGIIFAAISLFSLLFQPLFGLLSDKLGTCLLQLIMVTNKAIASQISQIKHFFHCILVVVCPNSSMYLIMSGSSRVDLQV